MCAAAALSTPPPEEPPQQEHAPSGLIRRFPAHEHLDQAFATMGSIMKGKGGKPKAFKEYSAGPESKPLSSRMLVTSMLVLVFCLLMPTKNVSKAQNSNGYKNMVKNPE